MSESSDTGSSARIGPVIIGLLVLLLVLLHQDFWFWRDDTLVFGVIPIGLFYHACISIGASVTWFLATVIAWPLDTTDEDLKEAAAGEEA
ncbi:MAG: DUF3311 domain-containing protein [Planctomycetota bacterium]